VHLHVCSCPEFFERLPGVARSLVRAVPLERRGGQALSIVFLGRLGDRKGTPELLLGPGALQDAGVGFEAVLAGDGEIDRFASLARSLGIDGRSGFPGWVPAEVAEQLLGAAHVLVLPSHAEGLPVSVLEAFAHARTVVTTDVGALPDIVAPGENGLIVPPGDVASLAEALEWLARDHELRVRLAAGARATWEELLSPAVCAPRLVTVWRRATAAGR